MAPTTTGLSDAQGGSRVSELVAQLLITTYKDEEGWPPDKTKAVWFSLGSITDIQTLINDNNGDGIRIYFGKYPSDVDIPGTPDPAYKGKVTLVMIPTVTGSDGNHNDIFPAVSSNVTAPDDGPEGYNHGSLCPPNCTEPPPPTNQ